MATETRDGKIIWPHKDMIAATIEWWEDKTIDPADCEVVGDTDGKDKPCLIVLHRPTGHTSTEAGDAGRWHVDGTAYGD